MLPPVEKKEIKKEMKKSGGPPQFNILDSILKGLEGCDDFFLEKPKSVGVKKLSITSALRLY